MYDVIIAQPVKILNSTAAIIKYTSAVVMCNSTNTIVQLQIFSDKQKLSNSKLELEIQNCILSDNTL